MRINAFVLALLMFISLLIPVGISAQTNDISTDYNNATDMLSQLDINNGIVFESENAITRAEFTVMLVRAVNLPLISADELHFKDCISNPFASEIATAYALGITSGTSETTFTPDGGVSIAAASKMVVTALGYGDRAFLMGGYPDGYLKIASQLDLLDNIDTVSPSLTVADAYLMIYNALLTDVAIFDSIDGENVVTSINKGKNLLTENFGLTHIDGIVTMAGFLAVSPDNADADKAEIDGMLLDTSFDISHFLGHKVDAWYDDDGTIRAICPDSSANTVTINADDVISCNDNVLNIEVTDGKNKKYNLADSLIFIKNGRAIIHNNNSFKFNDGTIKLIDNDSNGKYEYAIAEVIEYFVISGINMQTETIYDSKSNIKSICFDSNYDRNYTIEVDGAPSDISALKNDMVCEVMMSDDSGVCRVRTNTAQALSIEVSEVGTDYIIAQDSIYETNTYFKNLNIKISPGANYKFLLASDGTITALQGSISSQYNYGYFLGYAKPDGIGGTAKIKLLTDSGAKTVFDLASKIRVNGGDAVNSDSAYLQELLMNGTVPNYQLIKYKLNDDKLIIGIDTAVYTDNSWELVESKDWDDSLTKYMNKTSVYYRGNVGFGIPNVAFNNAIVFSVPRSLSVDTDNIYPDELFYLTNTSKLVTDDSYIVDGYDFDDSYLPKAVVVYEVQETVTASTPSNNTVSYIVRSVTDGIDKDGNLTKILNVYGDGLYKKFIIDYEYVEVFKNNGKIPSSGDIIRLSFNSEDYVEGIALDVEYDNGSTKVNYGIDNLGRNPWDYLVFISGRALSFNESYLALRTNGMDGLDTPDNIATLSLNNAKFVEFNTATGEAKAVDSDSIVTKESGDLNSASMIVARSTYYAVNTVYIYR